MGKLRVDEWRDGVNTRLEKIAVISTKQSGEISHIKETTDEIKILIKEQNGRVRSLEQHASAMKVVVSGITIIFTGLIGWLFNTKG
tara:strand:+ start:219 stop:476 length:258 start_codon:yes stop_codon:yes gene_type:complete